jgi:hypothetical protein
MEQGQFTDEQIVAVLQGAARGGKPVGEGGGAAAGAHRLFRGATGGVFWHV